MTNTRGCDNVAALKLAYERTIDERDRLRGARAFFARQLGPLPAFAGISAGLIGVLSEEIHPRIWLWAALAALILLIVLSFLYSGLPAYRQLRAFKEEEWRNTLAAEFPEIADAASAQGLEVDDLLSERHWYIAQIRLERELMGDTGTRNRPLPPSGGVEGGSLVDQLDRERTGVFVAQTLFVVAVGCLLIGRL